MDHPERSREYVQSFERGLTVLSAFNADRPTMTLSEVASATGLSTAVVRRFLRTAVELGYVRSDGRSFALTLKMLDLGFASLSSLTLPELAEPHMERLVATVGESSSLAVLDGYDMVYVARVLSRRLVNMAISVGTRLQAFASSMGRVLLAAKPESWLDDYLERVELKQLTPSTITDPTTFRIELERVCQQGYSYVTYEASPYARGLAVPIHSKRGAVIAALNVGAQGHSGTTDEIVEALLPPLRDCADDIDADVAKIGRDLSLLLGDT